MEHKARSMNLYIRGMQFIETLKENSLVACKRRFKRRFNKTGTYMTLWLTTIALLIDVSQVAAQQTVPVRVDRWIEIQQLSGMVTAVVGGTRQPAQLAARLQSVGDAVITGSASSATLAVDTAIGAIDVSENTSVAVSELTTLPGGGHITHLEVTGGQVRLELRRFTDPESELEIRTPAGISGVRGTTFGVSVQPSGQTGIATMDGSVVASAQGQQVKVGAGLQSLIIPGEPPTPPEPLRDDPQLDIRVLQTIESGTVQISGQTDPVNLLVINNEPQTLSETGEFEYQVTAPNDRRIAATVTTPLGTRQLYELDVP